MLQTQAEYYRINHDYVVSCAQLAKSGGCSQYHLVSAGGANKDSLLMPVRAKVCDLFCLEKRRPTLQIHIRSN